MIVAGLAPAGFAMSFESIIKIFLLACSKMIVAVIQRQSQWFVARSMSQTWRVLPLSLAGRLAV